MAESDPDLAAQLLAAFSAPTGALLPGSELSSLSYEGWQWAGSDGADLLSEQKTEQNAEPASGQTSQEHSHQEPPAQEPLPQATSAQEPLPQANSAQGPLPQEPPVQEHLPQESLPQEPSPQEPLPQEPLPQEPFPREALPQETPTQDPARQEALPQYTLPLEQGQREHLPQEHLEQPSTAPEPPPSPQKRARSRTPPTDNHGDLAEKRLKTDHHDLEHRDVDLSAANWDISAMIQNALGSFDEQLGQPHSVQNHGTEAEPAPETSQARSHAPRKVEQKRMKFSSNPYYVMRTMSLPLLGSLVSKSQRLDQGFPVGLTNFWSRLSRHCSHSPNSPEKRPWHSWPTRNPSFAKLTIR